MRGSALGLSRIPIYTCITFQVIDLRDLRNLESLWETSGGCDNLNVAAFKKAHESSLPGSSKNYTRIRPA
jgi:hypothetical protein